MNLNEFVAFWNGRVAHWPTGIGGQCVDLVNFWLSNCGLPPFTGEYAYQEAGEAWPRARWVANTPSGVPSPGDVVVWGTGIGTAGHTDVFVSGTVDSFTGFDQNWPVGSPCHIQPHSYEFVLGWQHLEVSCVGVSPPPPPPMSST